MKRKCLLIVITFFLTLTCAFSQEVTTINIINAHKTEYTKDTDTGNDTIILEGAVELSVTKGSTKTVITANKISYDRKTKMLFATGNVHMTSSGSSAGDENITASSLIFNSSTLEGVFDDGKVIQTQSDAINLPSGSTLVVFSDLFGKSESNTLAFKNASMTFCDDDDPHWKIKASRIWLLPGGEFALLNALLYVGSVPVLYLPAFYYPKDELIFNPVFGFRAREGFYIQTTTYLYGRKPLSKNASTASSDDEDASNATLDSLYNFMKPNVLKKQKLEGIVLHNLDEDFSGDTSQFVKFMGDWYSNLGFLAGVEGNFSPSNLFFDKLSFNFTLGFSNTIFKKEAFFSNISSSGQKYWDDSAFLSLKLPFRYHLNLAFSVNKPIKINISLPIYSDPFFAYDFETRNEDLNWISSVKELAEMAPYDESKSVTEVASLTWQVTTSYSAKLPDFFKPYISSLSMNTTSSLNIATMNDTSLVDKNRDGWNVVTPRRRFYYPSHVALLTASFSLSGTIFKWPFAEKKSDTNKNEKIDLVVALTKPDEFMTQTEKNKIESEKKSEENSEENQEENQEEKTDSETEMQTDSNEEFFSEMLYLPVLSYSPTNQAEISGISYSLTYSSSPNLSSQLSYASTGLKSADDFSWENYRSYMYTIKMPTSLNSNFSYGGNFLSVSNKLTYSPVWQKHPKISLNKEIGGYDESGANSIKRTDYLAESQDIINSNTVSFYPFVYTSLFKDSGLSWDTNIKVFQRKFIGDDLENPEWENSWADLTDKDYFTINSLTLKLATNELDNKFKQALTFTASLPPLDGKYNANLSLTFPFVSLQFSGGFYKTGTKENNDEKWVKNPFQQSASFSYNLLKSTLSLSESFNYNLEDKNPDSFKTSLSWKGFSASYTMSYTKTYDFDNDKGWISKPEKSFVPYSVSLSYSPPKKTFYKWKNRISIAPGLSTSIVADLVRPTNSYLTFSPSLTFHLNEFFDLTFSSTSRNQVLYRYFQKMFGHEGRIPGEDNFFIDLFNSFRFDNEAVRKSSGFKLKSLNVDISHELHDWKFKMSMKIEPRLITEGKEKYYDFSPYITIGVVWSPMEAIKTQIKDEYGEWKLE